MGGERAVICWKTTRDVDKLIHRIYDRFAGAR